MKKYQKIIPVLLLVLCLNFACTAPAYAVTEEEVQQQVDSVGKEAVSGNIFIWFLCAVAFLKASQKIDSFLSSLGINVGHTGGSLLAEAMIAGRGIASLRGSAGGGFSAKGGGIGGGPGGGDSGSGGFLSGGLTGAVGRHFSRSAANSVTGQGGGVAAGISRKMYESSLNKSGEFANKVTGAVAKGRIGTTGTMSGPTAATAMSSYFGLRTAAHASSEGFSDGSGGEAHAATGGLDFAESPVVSVPGAAGDAAGPVGTDVGGGADMGSGEAPHVPAYSDVEIGGGRITGIEQTAEAPDGLPFAMYSTDQYSKPQGDFSTVEAVDGSKWYKQYARDVVDRTPYMDGDGEIQYTEKIVKSLPRPPTRKDRI